MDISIDIFKDYRFTEDDALSLKELGKILLPFKQQMAENFYARLMDSKDTSKFFPDSFALRERVRTLSVWFEEVFSGRYDTRYLEGLKQMGYAHKKIDLDCHYVNASMHFVRSFCFDIIRKNIDGQDEQDKAIQVIEKILDINLDVLTASYRDAELKQVFVNKKVETLLVNFCERFSYGMNIMLVIGLVGLSISVLGLLAHEIHEVVVGNMSLEKGIITSLGTLLVVWVMIELMSTEINHLKGGPFSIKVFAEVALVSMIRDCLVSSLNHAEPSKILILGTVILILGIVYWLIARTDKAVPLSKPFH